MKSLASLGGEKTSLYACVGETSSESGEIFEFILKKDARGVDPLFIAKGSRSPTKFKVLLRLLKYLTKKINRNTDDFKY